MSDGDLGGAGANGGREEVGKGPQVVGLVIIVSPFERNVYCWNRTLDRFVSLVVIDLLGQIRSVIHWVKFWGLR